MNMTLFPLLRPICNAWLIAVSKFSIFMLLFDSVSIALSCYSPLHTHKAFFAPSRISILNNFLRAISLFTLTTRQGVRMISCLLLSVHFSTNVNKSVFPSSFCHKARENSWFSILMLFVVTISYICITSRDFSRFFCFYFIG